MEYLSELNKRKIPVGTVAYYTVLEHNEKRVKFGIVNDHYSNGIAITCLYFKNNKAIKSIYDKDFVSVDNFQAPTKWYKLPKGWTYNTQLIEWKTINWSEEIQKELNISNWVKDPNAILKAYKYGVLVDAEHNCFDCFETEITKDGWRIVRKTPSYGIYHPMYITLYPHKVYSTYEEAKKICDDYKAELDRQSNLSDYDWSVEQIDKTLNKLNWMDSEYKAKARDWLLKQDNVEDIVTRVSNNGVEWKYDRNKKWMLVMV